MNNGQAQSTEPQRLEYILTRRELEICDLVVEGLRSVQIAKKLFITHGTVRNHCTSIYEKTGCKNRVQLTIKYYHVYKRKPLFTYKPGCFYAPISGIYDAIKWGEITTYGEDKYYATETITKLLLNSNLDLSCIISLAFVNETFTIGRFDMSNGHKQCDFVFELLTRVVSHRHAKIVRLKNGFSIIDCKCQAVFSLVW